jgi:succinate dehydrogenase / fumarate reductase cytochrome b subunit
MNSADKRPVYLDLTRIKLPRGGLLSIIHRVSGVLLLLSIPLFIYLLQLLNSGNEGYQLAVTYLQSTGGKILYSLVLWTLVQHSMSGIRHLLMDCGFSYDKRIARLTANIAFILSFILIIAIGGWIWL